MNTEELLKQNLLKAKELLVLLYALRVWRNVYSHELSDAIDGANLLVDRIKLIESEDESV